MQFECVLCFLVAPHSDQSVISVFVQLRNVAYRQTDEHIISIAIQLLHVLPLTNSRLGKGLDSPLFTPSTTGHMLTIGYSYIAVRADHDEVITTVSASTLITPSVLLFSAHRPGANFQNIKMYFIYKTINR